MTEYEIAKNLHVAQTALNVAIMTVYEAGLLHRVFVIPGQCEQVIVEIMRPFEAIKTVEAADA